MLKFTQYPDHTVLELETRPERIISLVPSVTESMFEFGLTPVGRSSFCIEPAHKVDSIPRVGGTKTPNIKKIVQLNPDLVIANLEENTKEHIQAIRKENIPVWVTYPSGVVNALEMLQELSQLCLEAEQSKTVLNQYRDFLQTSYPQTEKKVLIFIWKDPWMVVGKDTYTDDLIAFAGAQNASDQPRYPELSENQVIKLDPDIVLLPTEPYAFKEQDVQYWKQKLQPKTQVLRFPGESLFWSGLRAIEASYALSQIFFSKNIAQ